MPALKVCLSGCIGEREQNKEGIENEREVEKREKDKIRRT